MSPGLKGTWHQVRWRSSLVYQQGHPSSWAGRALGGRRGSSEDYLVLLINKYLLSSCAPNTRLVVKIKWEQALRPGVDGGDSHPPHHSVNTYPGRAGVPHTQSFTATIPLKNPQGSNPRGPLYRRGNRLRVTTRPARRQPGGKPRTLPPKPDVLTTMSLLVTCSHPGPRKSPYDTRGSLESSG